MSLTRAAKVVSPLGADALLMLSLSAREALGRPFTYELELLSDDPRIDLSALLGQTMSVELELSEGSVREFGGHVTHFSLVGELGRYVRYRAVLRPWLWLLGHTATSRIFQNQSVPEVIKHLFREHGFTDFVELLSGEYRTWEYLVQYRESDLNFISRLMEQEGIYYFFKHEAGKHTLVLADSYSAHQPAPGYEEVPFFPPQTRERRERDHIDGWQVSRQMRSGAVSLSDYDFERPKAKVASTLRAPLEHAHAELEVYDYPASVRQSLEAEQQARVRLEERQVDYEVALGRGNARGVQVGGLFALTDFARDDQNKEYLVVDAHYEVRVDGYESGSSEPEEPDFRIQFTAIDSKRPFRAARLTPKPVVEGPQTAVVVGQEGQEIWTDQYGRVKVQFHWDREGAFDESSSCWIRVAQVWAGAKWGGIHIPRIGQEVIVDFLEGDPDRPIITGRVYNADNMPPYDLPANQTQSGIKSRTSKGGTPSNFNEIRFEDKKGQEELHVQAEKDMTTLVKNNRATTVRASHSVSVGGSRSISVGGDQTTTVKGTRSATTTKKETQTFKDAREMTVALTNSDTITGAHTGTYKTGRTLTVSGADDALTVNGVNKTSTVNGEYNIKATAQFKVTHGSDEIFLKGALAKITNGKCTVSLDGGKVTIEGPEEIVLKCGDSTITLKPSGIEVKGTKVSLDGKGSRLELAAAGATMSGPKCSVAGASVTEVTAPLVKIN